MHRQRVAYEQTASKVETEPPSVFSGYHGATIKTYPLPSSVNPRQPASVLTSNAFIDNGLSGVLRISSINSPAFVYGSRRIEMWG